MHNSPGHYTLFCSHGQSLQQRARWKQSVISVLKKASMISFLTAIGCRLAHQSNSSLWKNVQCSVTKMTVEELTHLVGFLLKGLDACLRVNLILPFLMQKVRLELLDCLSVMWTHLMDLVFQVSDFGHLLCLKILQLIFDQKQCQQKNKATSVLISNAGQ